MSCPRVTSGCATRSCARMGSRPPRSPPRCRRSRRRGARIAPAPVSTSGAAWTTRPSRLRSMGRLLLVLLAAAALLAGCGGSGSSASKDPAAQVPAAGGVRAKVRAAQSGTAAGLPAPAGRTLQQVADASGGQGPQLGLASSVFTTGPNRVAFGVIDSHSGFVYGKTAIYVAPSPDQPAQGPSPAPADVLLTQGRYRSKQAATEQDPFAAIYAAQVPFKKPGRYSILALTESGGKRLPCRGQMGGPPPRDDRIPGVGERPPPVETDTLASAHGDIASIDT